MIKETNQRIVKVHFKEDVVWLGNGCDCCDPDEFHSWNFSHIEGVENPEQYKSYDYEMYNGSKSDELDCLVSVFWDLVADQEVYEDFYDMCESFETVEESDLKLMLLAKGIEVVFLEE